MAKGEEKAGMRPRGAEGRGLALRRGAVEAVRPRTAERREREATPRHDMARVSPEESGTVLVGVVGNLEWRIRGLGFRKMIQLWASRPLAHGLSIL